MMQQVIGDGFDEWSYPVHMTGSGHGIGGVDDNDDIVDLLHRTIEEVTGKKIEKPEKIKIGFV